MSVLRDLEQLKAIDGLGYYSSAGDLFRDAVFGRDSIAMAEALLPFRPGATREIVVALARLQGLVDAPEGEHSSEEERGKIHHEHRRLVLGGREIGPRQREILEWLSSRWGGDGKSLTYYGAVDATPLFVRLVASCGEDIQRAPVIRRDGSRVTVKESAEAALDWVLRRLDSSDLGFLEFRRRNPDGIEFQVWKDSGTSYIHRDGRIANWDAPIAAVEVQGYAYDALVGAARLFPDRAPDLRRRAEDLRRRILERFWMPADAYFAMGIDRSQDDGRPELIDSIASNGALLLATGLFDGLPERAGYVDQLAERIAGPEFMTEAGIRCRSLAEEGLVDFQDYHGVWAVWAKESFEIFRGLHRQGFVHQAADLGSRILNAVNTAGANVEFLYVSPDGRVMYDHHGVDPPGPDPEVILGTNYPEVGQGWTVSAAFNLKRRLGNLPGAAALRRAEEFKAAYASRGNFVLDPVRGLELDQAARRRRTGSEPAAAEGQ